MIFVVPLGKSWKFQPEEYVHKMQKNELPSRSRMEQKYYLLPSKKDTNLVDTNFVLL